MATNFHQTDFLDQGVQGGWQKPYDNSWAGEASGGTVDLRGLTSYKDRFGIDWNVTDGGHNVAEINSTDGIRCEHNAAAYFVMTKYIKNLIEIGGGPDYRVQDHWWILCDYDGTWGTTGDVLAHRIIMTSAAVAQQFRFRRRNVVGAQRLDTYLLDQAGGTTVINTLTGTVLQCSTDSAWGTIRGRWNTSHADPETPDDVANSPYANNIFNPRIDNNEGEEVVRNDGGTLPRFQWDCAGGSGSSSHWIWKRIRVYRWRRPI